MNTLTSDIEIIKSKTTKIQDVDFENLSFGSTFSDHMLECNYKDGKWQTPKVVPYQAITLDPSAKIFHYGQSVFEGMKAYKDAKNDIYLFRPLDNWKRLNISSKRLAIPEVPESYFMEGLKTLLKVDSDWIPKKEGSSDRLFLQLAKVFMRLHQMSINLLSPVLLLVLILLEK